MKRDKLSKIEVAMCIIIIIAFAVGVSVQIVKLAMINDFISESKESRSNRELEAQKHDASITLRQEEEESKWVYAKITYYCMEDYPHICNNGDANATASQSKPTPYKTVATEDTSKYPFGTTVQYMGKSYVVEDVFGDEQPSNYYDTRFDILVETHEEAMSKGVTYAMVKIERGCE